MGINFLNDKFLFLDGAMGTMLQKSGLKLGERPETLSITNADLICDIHKQYINAGANIIYANTFGANDLKLKDNEYSLNEVITASINCAKNAVKGTDTQVALDVGPLGEMLKPAGSLSFDDAYNEFKKVVIAGENAGANLVVFETMTDIYEVKAAVLATKENTKLPIFVSMSFEENGRTFQGCPVEAMALVLEGLAVDAVGINCSLGPQEIFPLAKRLCDSTNLPVFVKPNAGLPNLKTGGYDLNPETFAEILKDYINLGIFAVGGCCGTTPDFICETKKVFEKYKPFKREQHFRAAICSGTKYLPLENICVIGERINPTGKKIFREALKNNDMDYILKQAVDQQEAGADILDVNVGTPGIDEPQMMINVVTNLQSVTDLPLQIDSSDPIAVEKALRIYNGKAIVNSVNGEKAVMDKLLPIVKKYGAAVVGLTLDENGIPPKAEERFAIAKHILETALSYGIAKENVLIDCLTLTASAQQAEVAETLKAVRLVKQNLGLKTVLGVSNISFGLPNRELLNHSFLLLAMGEGLDLPILNPNIDSMMSAVHAYRVLYNIDKQSSQYIDAYKDYTPTEQKIQKTSTG
ncbi:MAG: homocysteine S-methyltransferase family protein, partial [Oscillospiraceae bacterium]